jgi:hypothetical protein
MIWAVAGAVAVWGFYMLRETLALFRAAVPFVPAWPEALGPAAPGTVLRGSVLLTACAGSALVVFRHFHPRR